jgi:hypothetical protein
MGAEGVLRPAGDLGDEPVGEPGRLGHYSARRFSRSSTSSIS